MARAGAALFDALAAGRRERPDLFERLRMTSSGRTTPPKATGQKRSSLPPSPRRRRVRSPVPRPGADFTALHLLRQADMLVLPGSTDLADTASKLYPYILARRPLLAVFNEWSSVVDVLRRDGGWE